VTHRDLWSVGVLVLFGLTTLGLGLFMAVAPGTFFDTLGPFGSRNDHYTRDNASFNLANGALLLAAAGRPSWRTPALAFTTLQWFLHMINHLVDIGDAEPGWVGVFDAVSLGLGLAILASALLLTARADRIEAPSST
jgi:hypothetical protein